MNDNNNKKKEDEIIEFSYEGEKYKAKNIEAEQSLTGEKDKDKKITVSNLQKGFFTSKASINGKESKTIKYHWPVWVGGSTLILLVLGGLAWFLISRKNRQQAAQEENAL